MTRHSAVPPPVTAVLNAAGAWLPVRLAEVESRLGDLVGGHGKELAGDAAATLSAGGKRLRPMLVLICAGGEAGDAAVRAAASVELVHMATLVHDDVLDAAPIRRGIPTVVQRSGRERAVATGDLLFSRAFAELTAAGDGGERVSLLSAASVSLALGELAQRRDAYDTSVTVERYLERCTLKTARLFECACLLGRSTSSGEGSEALGAFGREVGIAFQLLDDVLDVSGPKERTGKAIGTDLLDGTVTLPLILAGQTDHELRAIDLRTLTAQDAAEVCERIAATGALDAVRRQALDRVAIGKRALADPAFSDEERRLLALVADGVVERYS
jgi:geranylgeranyl pyrophosphate synthase